MIMDATHLLILCLAPAAGLLASPAKLPTEPSFKKTRTVLDDENAAENGAAPMSND